MSTASSIRMTIGTSLTAIGFLIFHHSTFQAHNTEAGIASTFHLSHGRHNQKSFYLQHLSNCSDVNTKYETEPQPAKTVTALNNSPRPSPSPFVSSVTPWFPLAYCLLPIASYYLAFPNFARKRSTNKSTSESPMRVTTRANTAKPPPPATVNWNRLSRNPPSPISRCRPS